MKKTKNSKVVTGCDDIDGWELLSEEHKKLIGSKVGSDFKTTSTPQPDPQPSDKPDSKDNLFSVFQRIINQIANEPSYNNKTSILQKFLKDVSLSDFTL
jgi:hypothetical protein